MPLLAEGLARGMTDDVLTKEHLEAAMEAMILAPARPQRWIGPKWAGDILNTHPGVDGEHVASCPDCQRAWRAMVRS